jgi:hypothetical protein
MVEDKVRLAIADLLLEFNEIEFSVGTAVEGLLFCRDREAAEHVVRHQNFRSKSNLAKWLTKHYRERHPEIEVEAEALLKALQEADQIANQRNELAHAITSIDITSQLPVLVKDWQIFKEAGWTAINTDVDDLKKELLKARALKHEILSAYGKLRWELGRKLFGT